MLKLTRTAGIIGVIGTSAYAIDCKINSFENEVVPHIWRYRCGEFEIKTPLLLTVDDHNNISKSYVIPKFNLIAPFDSVKAHKNSEDARKLSHKLSSELSPGKNPEDMKKKNIQIPIKYVCSGHYNRFNDEYVVTSFETEYCSSSEMQYDPSGNYDEGGWLSCYKDGVKQIIQPWTWPFELPNSPCE